MHQRESERAREREACVVPVRMFVGFFSSSSSLFAFFFFFFGHDIFVCTIKQNLEKAHS